MAKINIYSKEQLDAKLDSTVPPTAGASAGSVLMLDANKNPVWSSVERLVALSITLANGAVGATVTATNGTDTYSGTTDSTGCIGFGVKPGFDYTVSTDGADDVTVYVGNAGASVTMEFGFRGFVGITITESTSDPSSRVAYPQTLSTGQGTYDNLAYGATPMSGAGSSFNAGSWGTGQLAKFIEDIKPVSFDGTTWNDLNKTDETSWPSTSGTDCFTEFPFRWLSITKSSDVITVVFSGQETQPDSTFQNWAFLGADGTTVRPNFHLGCYTASGSYSSGIYSAKGSTNLVSTALNRYWVGASKRGTEYDCLPFQMWTYIQALFLVLYKSTNSQAAHSKGNVGGSSIQSNSAFTSYGNDYGMYGTTANTTTQMAFFWLHNLWGNMYQYSASVFTRAGSSYTLYYILSAMSNSSNWDNSSWNKTSSSYRAKMTSLGTSSGSTGKSLGNYYTKACGSNGAGFIVDTSSSTGSLTTYYPDTGNVSVSSSYAYFPSLGGVYLYSDGPGIFYTNVSYNSTSSDSYSGSRLAYRGGHQY